MAPSENIPPVTLWHAVAYARLQVLCFDLIDLWLPQEELETLIGNYSDLIALSLLALTLGAQDGKPISLARAATLLGLTPEEARSVRLSYLRTLKRIYYRKLKPLLVDKNLPESIAEQPISRLGLNKRITTRLRNKRIATIGDLAQKTSRELLGPGFGQRSLEETITKLSLFLEKSLPKDVPPDDGC